MSEGFTTIQLPEQEEEKGDGLEVQNRNFELERLNFEAPVVIGPEDQITFTEDVDQSFGTIMAETDISELFAAEVLKKGNPPGCKSTYLLADPNSFKPGKVHLNKEELNAAITSGRLKLRVDRGGFVVIDKSNL